MPQIIEHLESVVGALETPPILMGHSAGGVFTQILMDHGFGAVGVAINSAPTESGSEDHLMPPKIQRSNAKHYKAEGLGHRSEGVRRPAPVVVA